MSSFIHFRSSCFQEETQASSFFECFSRYFHSIHWHHVLWCHHIHKYKSHQMHLATQLTRSSWVPTISLDSHQNIRLHTGACVNVVLLTYLCQQQVLCKTNSFGDSLLECSWHPLHLFWCLLICPPIKCHLNTLKVGTHLIGGARNDRREKRNLTAW